jgi:diketogulonate reductase-like aldo/keto reductase
MTTPHFIYGTAWKEQRTEALVRAALDAGFRAIDTANQRKHYHEAGVGDALRTAFERGSVTRDALFLQTKFTFRRGQDQRLPYDPSARIADQVRQSFERSLTHLGVSYLDSLVLHGPTHGDGLVDDDHEAWRTMEALQREGGARVIGVSNVSADQLALLVDFAEIAPAYVQNRCYAADGWDEDVRAIAERERIVYQGFSLLTANRKEAAHPTVLEIAARNGCTPAQLIFRFAGSLGILPLTGTTDPVHMQQDLAALELALSDADSRALWAATT